MTTIILVDQNESQLNGYELQQLAQKYGGVKFVPFSFARSTATDLEKMCRTQGAVLGLWPRRTRAGKERSFRHKPTSATHTITPQGWFSYMSGEKGQLELWDVRA